MNLADANIEQVGFDIPINKHKTYHGRLYEMDGQLGSSVSMACDVISPLFLQEWRKSNTARAINKRLEETAGPGTQGHLLIEKQAEGEKVTPPEELKEWFTEWDKTQIQYSITAEQSEVKVFSKTYAYGGRIDRIGEFNGKRCIIDFKTGSYSHINLWKTEAYRQAYVEMTGDKDVGAIVLHLPRPDLMARGHKVRHYTIQRHTSCFLAFLSAYQTFRMLYFKDLLKAGMREEDVFAHSAFKLYERENG